MHLNNSIPTDCKILIRLINMAAIGCFHTSFASRRKILHYLSLSRVFFINFSHSSTVSPERGKSPTPPHDPQAHNRIVTADRGRKLEERKRIGSPILGVKNRFFKKLEQQIIDSKIEIVLQKIDFLKNRIGIEYPYLSCLILQ